MDSSLTCPNCGSTAMEGAATCNNCGSLLTPPAPQQPSEPPPEPAGAGGPKFSQPGTAGGFSLNLADVAKRWNVEQSPILIAALAMLGVALAVGTYAIITSLLAGDTDFEARSDAQALFLFAIPLSVGASALMAYLRLQAGPLSGEPDEQDRQFMYVLYGFSIAFMLPMLFKGFDEGLEAETAWYYYAQLFAFFALALCLIAKPVPSQMGTTSSSMIGLIAVGVAVVAGAIGVIQGMSSDFSSFAIGVTLEDAALVLMTLSLAWFLGMRRAEN